MGISTSVTVILRIAAIGLLLCACNGNSVGQAQAEQTAPAATSESTAATSPGVGKLTVAGKAGTKGFPVGDVQLADRVWLSVDARDAAESPHLDYVTVRAFAYIGTTLQTSSKEPSWAQRFWNAIVGGSATSTSILLSCEGKVVPLFSVARGLVQSDGSVDHGKFTVEDVFGRRVIGPRTYTGAGSLEFTIEIRQGASADVRVIESLYQAAQTVTVALGGPPAGLVAGALAFVGEERDKMTAELNKVMSSKQAFKHEFTFSVEDLKRRSAFDLVFYEKSDKTGEIVRIKFEFERHSSLLGDVEDGPIKRLSGYSRDNVLRVEFLKGVVGLQGNEGTLGQLVGYFTPETAALIEQAKANRAVFEAYCQQMQGTIANSRLNSLDYVYAMHAVLSAVPYTKTVGPQVDGSACPGMLEQQFQTLGLLPVARERGASKLNESANTALDKIVLRLKGDKSISFASYALPSVQFRQTSQYYPGLSTQTLQKTPKELDQMTLNRLAKTAGLYSAGEFVEGLYWRKLLAIDFDEEQAIAPAVEAILDFLPIAQPDGSPVAKLARLTLRERL